MRPSDWPAARRAVTGPKRWDTQEAAEETLRAAFVTGEASRKRRRAGRAAALRCRQLIAVSNLSAGTNRQTITRPRPIIMTSARSSSATVAPRHFLPSQKTSHAQNVPSGTLCRDACSRVATRRFAIMQAQHARHADTTHRGAPKKPEALCPSPDAPQAHADQRVRIVLMLRHSLCAQCRGNFIGAIRLYVSHLCA